MRLWRPTVHGVSSATGSPRPVGGPGRGGVGTTINDFPPCTSGYRFVNCAMVRGDVIHLLDGAALPTDRQPRLNRYLSCETHTALYKVRCLLRLSKECGLAVVQRNKPREAEKPPATGGPATANGCSPEAGSPAASDEESPSGNDYVSPRYGLFVKYFRLPELAGRGRPACLRRKPCWRTELGLPAVQPLQRHGKKPAGRR